LSMNMLLYICLRLLASVNKLKVLDISFFKQLFSWVNAALRFILILDVKSIYMAPIHLIHHTDQENTGYKVLVIFFTSPLIVNQSSSNYFCCARKLCSHSLVEAAAYLPPQTRMLTHH
jgi:hypothetical protein